MAEALCFDIGGPLFDHFAPEETSDPSEVPDAFETIAALAGRFGDRRHAILRCSEGIEARTRAWLSAHRFVERTGVTEGRIHFCRRDETKISIIRDLGVTHMVDNSLVDLLALRTVGRRILLNGLMHEIRRHYFSLRRVTSVQSWSEVAACI